MVLLFHLWHLLPLLLPSPFSFSLDLSHDDGDDVGGGGDEAGIEKASISN